MQAGREWSRVEIGIVKQVPRHHILQAERYLAAGERLPHASAQTQRIVELYSQRGKITLPEWQGNQVERCRHAGVSLALALIVDKKEQLVALDRSADGAAEDILT